jgi:hypothetical protein
MCEMANVTVPAGTYNAYNISVDLPNGMHGHYSSWEYYMPNEGFYVKAYESQTTPSGQPDFTTVYELVSTTHTP